MLATKTHQADVALRQWVDVPVVDGNATVGTAGELLPILTALNGVVSEEMALRYFERVIGVCVWMPAAHIEPGEVIVRGTPIPGTFHIGTVPGRSRRVGAARPRRARLDCRGVAHRASRRRHAVEVPQARQQPRQRVPGPRRSDTVRPDGSSRAAEDEARAVLEAAGVEVIDDETEAAERATSGLRITEVPGQLEPLGGSSWQSLARGTGDIETDYLNGEIVLIARRHGMKAPINAGIARLARRAAAEGQAPGAITAEALAGLLGL